MMEPFRPEDMDDDYGLELEVPSLEDHGDSEEDLSLAIPDSNPTSGIEPPGVWIKSLLSEKEVISLFKERQESGELLPVWCTAADSPKPVHIGPMKITFSMLLEMSFLGIDATLELPSGVNKSLRDPEVMEKFISGRD